jgi:hypothetical protein
MRAKTIAVFNVAGSAQWATHMITPNWLEAASFVGVLILAVIVFEIIARITGTTTLSQFAWHVVHGYPWLGAALLTGWIALGLHLFGPWRW